MYQREVSTQGGGLRFLKVKKESRFACFGTANSSDTCMQCPDNTPCAEETITQFKKAKSAQANATVNKKVKIFCHACNGKKFVLERTYPDGEEIKTVCPECDGTGFVWDELSTEA